VVMKSVIFWDITPCSPLRSTEVSEEHIASIFRVACHLLSFWFPAQPIFSTIKMDAICFSETSVDTNRLHGFISQMMIFFIYMTCSGR
jgi:hypothetical protein